MAFCPSCGQPTPQGADRCPRCEAALPTASKRGPASMPTLAAALLAAVLTACLVAYFVGWSQRTAPVVMTGPLKLPTPQLQTGNDAKPDEIHLGDLDQPLVEPRGQLRLSTPNPKPGGLRLSTPNPGAFSEPQGEPASGPHGGAKEPLTLHSRERLMDRP